MEKSSIYPVVDEKREKRISICQERLIYGASVSFFSQHFKRSEEEIDWVLRGYTARGTIKAFFFKREICLRADFD